MTEQKKKKRVINDHRMGTWRFAGAWSGTYALGWMVTFGMALLLGRATPQFWLWFPEMIYFLGGGALLGMVSGSVQQMLLRHKFAIDATRWWLWNTVAWSLTVGGFYVLEGLQWQIPFDNQMVTAMIVLGTMFVPPAIVQAWRLRRHMQSAWLWVGAALASTLTFAIPLMSLNGYWNDLAMLLTLGAAGLMQGMVMGITLLWLMKPASREALTAQQTAIEQQQQQQLQDAIQQMSMTSMSDSRRGMHALAEEQRNRLMNR